MNKSLSLLIDNVYTDKQKLAVKRIVKEVNVKDTHLLNYKILATAIEDEIEATSEETIEEFYQVESDEYEITLQEVDYVIADIILTLTKLTGKDIKTGYENALVLDKTQPEFEYLVNEASEFLYK